MPPTSTASVLRDLRALMATSLDDQQRPLAAYIVPTDDAHQSEYISAHDERRRFVSAFDGSAGTAVITAAAGAHLWTDARYYQQALQQLDPDSWQLQRAGLADTPEPGVWLAERLQPGAVVGADARLLSARAWQKLAEQLEERDVELRAVAANLVDRVWGAAQPAQTSNAVVALPGAVAGRTVGAKVAELRQQMRARNADVLVVTALDEVACKCWGGGGSIDRRYFEQ